MTDPKRWMNDGATPLERSLLDAMKRDRPSPALERRMRRALGLGLGGSLLVVKAAAAVIATAAVITGGIVVTASVRGGDADPQPSRPALAAPSESPRSGAGTGSTTEVEPSVEQPELEPPARTADAALPAVAAKAADASPAAKGASAPEPARSKASPANLTEEIRLLDRARVALREKAPARALSELARYNAQFPRGTFRQEASVLRIDALKRAGEGARAAALAQDFVAKHPNSPHVDRLQRLVGSPDSKP